jgi:O-acetyl-ADP-ribose deacetylase
MHQKIEVFVGDIATSSGRNRQCGEQFPDGRRRRRRRAIHRAAGPDLLEECRLLGRCRTGDAKVTKGYRLSAAQVIHTVGPVWLGGNAGEDELLASCYRRSLKLADKLNVKSLAFPAISTGINGFPMIRAARIAVTEIRGYTGGIERLIFACFDAETADIYRELLTI